MSISGPAEALAAVGALLVSPASPVGLVAVEPVRLLPPMLEDLEDVEDDELRALYCQLRHGEHEPYTHRHAGEPDVTYCLRCRCAC